MPFLVITRPLSHLSSKPLSINSSFVTMPYKLLHYLWCIYHIYNAITLNKPEIDRVHKNELCIATVSIKQKVVDRIKTALRFWFNATRISARMRSKTMTFVTSTSTIVMERYVNEQTDKKKIILQRSALSERRYRRFRLRSDSRTFCQNKQNGGQWSSKFVSK